MISDKIEELITGISLLKRDAEKFDRGNASAGTRVRKDLMKLIKEMKDIRQSILDERKERKSS